MRYRQGLFLRIGLCSHVQWQLFRERKKLLAGQFLLQKTISIRQSSLRRARNDLVPSGTYHPRTSSMHFLLQYWRQTAEMDGFLTLQGSSSCLLWEFVSSDLSVIVSWLAENFADNLSTSYLVPSFVSRNWHCLTRLMDVTTDGAIELKTWELREAFWWPWQFSKMWKAPNWACKKKAAWHCVFWIFSVTDFLLEGAEFHQTPRHLNNCSTGRQVSPIVTLDEGDYFIAWCG